MLWIPAKIAACVLTCTIVYVLHFVYIVELHFNYIGKPQRLWPEIPQRPRLVCFGFPNSPKDCGLYFVVLHFSFICVIIIISCLFSIFLYYYFCFFIFYFIGKPQRLCIKIPERLRLLVCWECVLLCHMFCCKWQLGSKTDSRDRR